MNPDGSIRTSYEVTNPTTGQTTTVTVRTKEIADLDGYYRLPTGPLWAGPTASPTARSNDQRSVAADILSFYSITDPNSASYQAARNRLTGTSAEQDTKAEHLFASLFDKVFIGDSGQKNNYSNIRYVLGKLGISNNTEGGHHHHFHIRMSVPTIRLGVESSKFLMAETQGDKTMLDLASTSDYGYYALNATQAETPPAVIAPTPNWIKNDKRLLEYLDRSMKDVESFKSLFYEYEENGPLGIPRLTVDANVDYYLEKQADGSFVAAQQGVGLAQRACVCLDVEAKQAGAWGPECRIAKILEMPKGKLVKDTRSDAREGDYLYTPIREGSKIDSVRYILENGAGRQVEVIFTISAINYRAGNFQLNNSAHVVQLGSLGMIGPWLQAENSTALGTIGNNILVRYGALALPEMRQVGVWLPAGTLRVLPRRAPGRLQL